MGSLSSSLMAEAEELVLSAWQIYTALFVMFWASQLYLSSFWMSVVCCIKFGLISQLVTDYMYRRGRYKESHNSASEKVELDTLLGLAKQEASLVPSLTALAKEEASQSQEPGQASDNERSVTHERQGFRPSNL